MALGLAFLLAGKLGLTQGLQLPGDQSPPSAPQPAAPATLTAVHGVVRNAATGAPLPRTLVRIEGGEIAALTDGEGRFELTGVAVGPQIIRLRKPGFLDRPYASEDMGYQNDGPAHSVLVVAEMPDLNFKLTPTSAIHGRIELSTGDPAQGIQITLLKQMIRDGRAVWTQNGSTKTNGSGAYRFAGLPAGVYALYTQPTLESEPVTAIAAPGAKVARNGYPSVFYPEAREFSGAARIRLKAGDQVEANLLLTLEPFYAVKAAAILPNGKPYSENDHTRKLISESFSPITQVIVLDTAGNRLAYEAQYDQRTQSFQVFLPDGVYTLFVVVSSDDTNYSVNRKPNGHAIPEVSNQSGFTEFSVDGNAITNLKIPLAQKPNWLIHLRILQSSSQTSSSLNHNLNSVVTIPSINAGEAPMDNGFMINSPVFASTTQMTGPDQLEMYSAEPGPHWISTEVNDRSLCVDSFSAGGVNLAREPLNVALGASPPPMELTLRDDCAKLALTLPPALADFLPGEEPFYTVYVVPDFDTTADIPPMTVHPSSGATLTVDGLTPGSYHVYVFNEPVRLEYRNPAVLAALPTPGQQVSLSPGTTGNLMLEVPAR
jgi:hypothetical protein